MIHNMTIVFTNETKTLVEVLTFIQIKVSVLLKVVLFCMYVL